MIQTQIKALRTCEGLSEILFTNDFRMISLETCGLKVGLEVSLSIKPSHVGIAKERSFVSQSNQFPMKIKSIDKGQIVSFILLSTEEFELESIITTASVNRLELKENDDVFTLIKASDVSISEMKEV